MLWGEIMTRKSSKTKTVSLGWHKAGWVPEFIHHADVQDYLPAMLPGRYRRVRITVEQVFDKRGRAIERVVK